MDTELRLARWLGYSANCTQWVLYLSHCDLLNVWLIFEFYLESDNQTHETIL